MIDRTRRLLIVETCIDWLALVTRLALYALVSAPVWGTVFAFAIVWDRLHP